MSKANNIRERKKEATKRIIIETAVRLIHEHGFHDTTMQLIASRANIALRTLYNYFPSKESIVATYVQISVKKEQEKNWSRLTDFTTTMERLEFLCLKSYEWMKANIVLAEIYTLELDPRSYICDPEMTEFPRSGLADLVQEILIMGQKMGDVTSKVPVSVLTRQFLGFYHFSILTWLCDTSQDLGTIFCQGIKLLFSGIGSKGISSV